MNPVQSHRLIISNIRANFDSFYYIKINNNKIDNIFFKIKYSNINYYLYVENLYINFILKYINCNIINGIFAIQLYHNYLYRGNPSHATIRKFYFIIEELLKLNYDISEGNYISLFIINDGYKYLNFLLKNGANPNEYKNVNGVLINVTFRDAFSSVHWKEILQLLNKYGLKLTEDDINKVKSDEHNITFYKKLFSEYLL